jgi:hypothetical protein
MRLLSETRGIEKLREIRSEFAAEVLGSYEHKAKPCALCESPGICCRDEHFVNVRITRLEAAAIVKRLDEMGEDKRNEVCKRAAEAIDKYDLSTPGDSLSKTYACPLFEKGIGCLVHDAAKPLPCIAHACYENEADLPPGELLEKREILIAGLNRRVYGKRSLPISIPVATAGNLNSKERG